MAKIVPVILCGGNGTRLWPKSRASKPKPFIPLLGEETLFEATLNRCGDRNQFDAPIIVVGEDHLPFASQQAQPIAPDAQFIVEPVGRSTAPAIALAALRLPPETIMLVCPSDHRIARDAAFISAAASAARLAEEDWLVSFGIEATAPETGYGYIRRGAAIGGGHAVRSFVEKPDRETALRFLAEGDYAWNGGIFALRAGAFLDELDRHRPELAALTRLASADGHSEGQVFRPEAASFRAISGESIDYAVMENTDRAAMVDVAMGWSDIGNWDTLLRERLPEGADNVVVGPGEIIDAKGSMIDSDGPHVTVIGADDVVVVVSGDDILVAARDAAQRVGEASRCRTA